MQWTKYVGIPYLDKGRDTAGIDCWGLARLIYTEEFGVTLPSFSENYESDDTKRIADLIAVHKENWKTVEEPKPGHLVLFRVLGHEMHIGVYIGRNKFIHAIENSSSGIERIDSMQWKNRLVGFFEYTEASIGGTLNARPHPLRTQTITMPIAEGTTLRQISEWVVKEYDVKEELVSSVVIVVNGEVVPVEEYETRTVAAGDILQYRSVPGKSALRMVLVIALAYFAGPIAGWIQGGMGAWTGAAATGFSGAVLTGAVTMVGTLLINAIVPIRPPTMNQPNDPGSPGRQLMMAGGSNQANKYGAIPVVLGRVRMTAMQGARNFVESSDENSDLNMLLVWGFGPLVISNLNIGATDIDQYENGVGRPIQYAHLNDSLAGDPYSDVSLFNSIYAGDVEQNYHGVRLVNNPTDGEPWTESTIVEPDIFRLAITYSFPQGLRHIIAKGESAGNIYPKECLLELQYRALDVNGDPLYDWTPNTNITKGANNLRLGTGNVTTQYYSWGDDGNNSITTSYYRWTRVALDQNGNWVYKTGSYLVGPYTDPVPRSVQSSWWSYNYDPRYDPNSTIGYVRLPVWSNGEIPVVDICIYGTTLYTTDISARRVDYAYVGFSVSNPPIYTPWYWQNDYSNAYAPGYVAIDIAAGYVSKGTTVISLGINNYVKRKDPFTHTQYITVPPNPGGYQVRTRRKNNDNAEPDDTNRYMHDVQLQSVTGYTNRKPVLSPPGCRITQTAMRVRATDQLSGQIEGINALVETICLDWNKNTQTWVYAVTNNPASLFRYVLQHSANAQRISDADIANRVDLEALQDWHEYCQAETFQYNDIIAQQKSLLDVLKDIAAAGRASPITIDGRWSVVIDRPRVDIVQHFTPHNSWGFEGVKRLPKQPDGLKVTINNELRGYQEEEVIVYNTGKNENNSELFEQITLPGVTRVDLAIKHTRWHFAQAKLRPEIYSLNTDMEYLIATRGDRVKVMHDVTMWGLGSGRIKNRVSTTVMELDEAVPMKAGLNYSMRIRSSTGASVIRNIVPVAFDNYYTTITFTADTTLVEVAPLDLFMFGETNSDSNDLVILSIEPFGSGNAKITLTDYSPEIYNVNYQLSNFYIPEFSSKISRPPELLIYSISTAPEITSIVSDETVLERISPGVFKYNLKVGIRNAVDLPSRISGVEVQIDYAEDSIDNWKTSGLIPVNKLAVTFDDVIEGDDYKIRARYIAEDGRYGPWSAVSLHTIVGKTTPPSTVTNFTELFEPQSATFKLSWTANTEIDIKGYEIRTANTGWGTSTAFIYKGNETSVTVPVAPVNSTITYYIKAFDYSGLYSLTAITVSTLVVQPSIPRNLSYTYAVQSVSGTTAVIDWDTPLTIALPISYYEITIVKPQGTTVVKSLTTEYMTLVDWTTASTLSVVAVDTKGGRSNTATLILPKAAPETPGTITYLIQDTAIALDWADSIAGSLPVAGYEIRTADSGWGTNASYITRTSSSKATLTGITVGNNTWYIRAFDTAGQYSNASSSLSLVIRIPLPPTNIQLTLSDTNISGAQALISWNTPTLTTFAIKEYQVTLTKYPGPTTSIVLVAGSSLAIPVDWKDTINISIRTVDISGNVSNAEVFNYSKVPPGNILSTVTALVPTGGVQISWPAPTKGTLAIDGYEIRTDNISPGAPGFIYRGSTNSVVLPQVTLGTNTWYIWAYDTDGHYSAASKVISFVVTAPNSATNLSAIFNTSSNTSSTCTLRWVPPNSVTYNISKYLVSFSYTNPVNSSISVYRDTTDWEIPANWMDNATLSVQVIDILGNSSTISTLVVAKQAPNTPGVCTMTPAGNSMEIDWPDTLTTTLPVTLYELRNNDSGWGTAGYVWKGTSSSTRVSLPSGIGTRTWYLKAIDSDGRYSTTAQIASYTVLAPGNPTVYPAEFADTSLTSATVNLYWDAVDTIFGVQGYEVTYNGNTELVNATTLTVAANWLGDRTFVIKTVDGLGNKSVGATIVATQLPPNPATNFRAQVIDNNVLLYWSLPAKTTLPISHVSLRKGSTWESGEVIGDKDGTFTSISELSGGTITYWLAVVDTDNNVSTPTNLTASVSQPPDFIFNAEYISTLSGTKVNCAFDSLANDAVVLPVNTVENFGQHFTLNGWDQPSDQIAAGYPVYIQPGSSSGYYEEIFDYGTPLGSSQVTLSITGNIVYGNPTVNITISTSLDGITYTDFTGSNSIFAVNFKYVKIRVGVSQQVSGDIYRISGITVRLDAKQKTEGGNVLALLSDSTGTTVNFAQEFIDIVSITLSAQGIVPLNPVYDIKDSVISGTYTITSDVATINATDHGMVVGQRIRLFFTDGTGISGRYIITSVVNVNSYTVSMIAANSSGNVKTYPNSMRVYLFDQAGARVSGSVSWAVRGY